MSTVEGLTVSPALDDPDPTRPATPSPSAAPALVVEGAWKIFGRRAEKIVGTPMQALSTEELREKTGCMVAVRDVSFEVAPGEIFVVMGLSGSGKSTLIRMLNGLQPPTTGRVTIQGEDLASAKGAQLRRIRRECISMVFQHFALFPHRTVLDNAAYGLESRGVSKVERRARAHEALELCGLHGWDEHLPGQLSGGMRQRVGLARALAADTDILLMDEAFSALDPLIRHEMQDQLIELQRKLGKTIIFITHDLNEAMRLGDRIAMMRNGVIEQIGTAEDILTKPANKYVAEFVADVDRTKVITAASIAAPAITVAVDATVDEARDQLRHTDADELVVVDAANKGVGALTRTELTGAASSTRISELMTPLGETVHQRTVIAELCGVAATSSRPVAVVDDDGRLVGIVTRGSLLSALHAASGDAPVIHEEELHD